MSDQPQPEDTRDLLRDALLSLDERYPAAYKNETYFHHTLDVLLSMIPAMVDGLWTASADNEERMKSLLAKIESADRSNVVEALARIMGAPEGEPEQAQEPSGYVPPGMDPDGPPRFNKALGTWVGGRQRR